jgi:hypothetical protein
LVDTMSGAAAMANRKVARVRKPTKRSVGRPRTWVPTPLGERIQSAAADRGWTIHQLATASGVDVSSLYRVMAGEVDPRLSTMVAVAGALRRRIDELVH